MDSNGGVLGVVETREGETPGFQLTGVELGRWAWRELWTKDDATRKAMLGFYTAAMGWKDLPIEKDGKIYHVLANGKDFRTGVILEAQPGEHHRWVTFAIVKDADAGAARMQKAGGRVLLTPRQLGTKGRYALVGDPTGARIAIWSLLPGQGPKPN
jgi:uncharacterized protein